MKPSARMEVQTRILHRTSSGNYLKSAVPSGTEHLSVRSNFYKDQRRFRMKR